MSNAATYFVNNPSHFHQEGDKNNVGIVLRLLKKEPEQEPQTTAIEANTLLRKILKTAKVKINESSTDLTPNKSLLNSFHSITLNNITYDSSTIEGVIKQIKLICKLKKQYKGFEIKRIKQAENNELPIVPEIHECKFDGLKFIGYSSFTIIEQIKQYRNLKKYLNKENKTLATEPRSIEKWWPITRHFEQKNYTYCQPAEFVLSFTSLRYHIDIKTSNIENMLKYAKICKKISKKTEFVALQFSDSSAYTMIDFFGNLITIDLKKEKL